MRGLRVAALPLVVVFLATGCGDGDENGGATAPEEATTLRLAADPNGALAFDKETLEAPAGTVTIELANESSVPHNVAVENGVSAESDTVTGETTTMTVDLEAGDYTFYCSVPGHREAGMEGTLTIS